MVSGSVLRVRIPPVIGLARTSMGTRWKRSRTGTLEWLSILREPPMRLLSCSSRWFASRFAAVVVAFAVSLTLLTIPASAAAVHSRHGKAHASRAHSSRPVAGSHQRLHRVPASRRVYGGRRVRRGALAAARRRAHDEDATPRPLKAVHLAMPPPLRGSHESLVHQNEMAEAEGLERIQDDADLADRIAHGSLVPIPASAGLQVNTDLPENRRYCRPWTAKFLRDLARAHSARFASSALEVTSAVRTVEYQRRLRTVNGNAAAADGDIASPHLTGGTIDLAKQGLSAKEIGWLRGWLIPLEQAGKIDVEEEFRQSCFHISVYKSYGEAKPASRTTMKIVPLDAASMLPATAP